MSDRTKVSKYKTGQPRFSVDKSRLPDEVKEYILGPDELAELNRMYPPKLEKMDPGGKILYDMDKSRREKLDKDKKSKESEVGRTLETNL